MSSTASRSTGGSTPSTTSSSPAVLVGSWLVVGLPLAYGIYQTLVKASKLFTG